MFKKKLSAILATALVAVMLPTTFLAGEWNTNGGQSEVEGENYGVEPIIEVELPGDLVFGINPLYLDANEDGTAGDAQIVTGQYVIKNFSNVDVLVSTATSVRAGDGVDDIEFMATNTRDAVTGELESTSDARRVYLVQMLPKAAATIATDDAVILDVNEFTLASGAPNEIAGLVLGSDAATALFKLDACAVSGDAYVLESDNVSGFEFAGAVDPDKSFYDGEVIVKTVFTLTTLTENQSNNAYTGLLLNGATYDETVVQATPAATN